MIAVEDVIYKIVTRQQWKEAEKAGVFKGAPIDLEDGYIHFSTGDQVEETAAKHFAGQADLLLVAVSSAAVSEQLTFEPSRGGQLFPHLYADLPLAAVMSVRDLSLGADGRHHLPDDSVPTGRSGEPTIR